MTTQPTPNALHAAVADALDVIADDVMGVAADVIRARAAKIRAGLGNDALPTVKETDR